MATTILLGFAKKLCGMESFPLIFPLIIVSPFNLIAFLITFICVYNIPKNSWMNGTSFNEAGTKHGWMTFLVSFCIYYPIMAIIGWIAMSALCPAVGGGKKRRRSLF